MKKEVLLTAEEKRTKRIWAIALGIYFIFGYLFLNQVNLHRAAYVDVSFGFERNIPFVPEAIFGYMLVYFSVLLLYFIFEELHDFYRSVVVLLVVTTVHFICFVVIPVRMELRPEVGHMTGISATLTRLYYVIDQPTNLFPSLHVAYPTAATWLVWRPLPRWRLPYIVMTMIISISVILVKQHYIADVVVGFFSSTFVVLGILQAERRWFRAKPSSALH